MTRIFPIVFTKGNWRLDRLAVLSDGVIAVVITILVLGIEVPSAHDVNQSQLRDYLWESLPSLAGYVASFFFVGMYWMQHYAIFHFLTHANRLFVVLNLCFLLCLSFLPFPTGLHAVYFDDALAVVIYGVAQILCGSSLLILWLYSTTGHRLVSPTIPSSVVTSMTRRLALTPVISVVGIGASFISPWLGRLVFLVIPCCYISQRAVDQGWIEMQAAPRDGS